MQVRTPELINLELVEMDVVSGVVLSVPSFGLGMLRDTGIMAACIAHSGVVAGGFWRSLVMGDIVRDIDIFTTNYQNGKALVERLQQIGCTLNPDMRARGIWELHSGAGVKINVIGIKDWFKDGSVTELLARFDFRCCMYSTDPTFDHVLTTQEAFNDTVSKRLMLNNPNSASRSLERTIKFARAGWDVPRETLRVLALQIIADGDYSRKEFSY